VSIYPPFKRTGYFFAMTTQIRAFLKDQSGATAIEYGLLAAAISTVIITVVQGIGHNLKTVFGSVSSALK
jgi:pilus assembly protein Flp/PilA